MRQLPVVFAAIIGAIAIVRTAEADYLTGNELHWRCSGSDPVDRVLCMGYISGAASVLIDVDPFIARPTGTGTRLCVPQVPLGQMVDVVKVYLVAHPEKRHEAAWALVSFALREAFPCK